MESLLNEYVSCYNINYMKNDLCKCIIQFYEALGIDILFDNIPITNALDNNKQNFNSNNITSNNNLNYTSHNIQQVSINSIHDNKKIFIENINNPSLQKLLQEINSINCLIKSTARNTVVFDGDINSKVMIIGEAPGQEEDIQGKPFVGQSGILLNNMLKSIGLSRQDVIISNIVFWRPPFNRTPSTDEISLCLPYVKQLIQIINPKVLLLLGGVANHALLNTMAPMSRIRGTINNVLGIKAVSTYHPAYLLRSSTQKKQAFHDFLLLKHIIDDLC